MIVVIDEGVDPGFQVAGQIVVLQQDVVLERLMQAFDADGVGRRVHDPCYVYSAIRSDRMKCRRDHYLRAIGGNERRELDRAPRPAARDSAFP